MRNIAGICRRIMAVATFICLSVVVCSGVNKRALILPSCIKNQKCCSTTHEKVENMQPSQLVSIRIMQLI